MPASHQSLAIFLQTSREETFPGVSPVITAHTSRGSSLAVWEQQEGTAACCNPAAGPGLLTVTKWALWRLKPSEYRAKGWLLHAALDGNEASHTRTNTHSILPRRTRANTQSTNMHAHWYKSCIHHGCKTSEHTNNNTHTSPQLVSMTIATKSHWVHCSVKKKCSSEFRSLASCGANDLNSQF